MATRRSASDNAEIGADGAPLGVVPNGLVIAAAFAWRIAIIGVVVVALFTALTTLTTIVLPLMIALLICAPLERLVTRMARHKIPRGLGAGIVLLGLITAVLGLIALAGNEVISGLNELRRAAGEGFDTLLSWLSTGPLNLDQGKIDGYVENATHWLQENWSGIANGALSVTGTIGTMFAGVIIALIALYFFLRDGRSMWLWIVTTVTGRHAEQVDNAGRNAWITLRKYTQTSAFVAFVAATGIGLAAWILGLPLVFPIAILVFLTSFIPMFGATISGAVAVLVALVDGGWTTALIMLAAVLVVQQLEGSILYPWLFGKAVSIHPMVILVSISTGTLVAGLVGALIAVPLVSFTYAFAVGLRKEYVVEEPLPISGQLPQLAKRTVSKLYLPRRKRADAHRVDSEASDMTTELPTTEAMSKNPRKRT